MASDLIGQFTDFRGFLVPDRRHVDRGADAIDTSESTLTQAGPRPGVPEPQTQTEMVLESSGDQVAGEALRIRTIKSGLPVTGGAGFAWEIDGDALERGWDVPTIVTAWEAVRYLDGTTTTATAAKYLDAVSMADRTIVTAYEIAQTSPSTRDVIAASYRNPTTGAWSDVTVATNASSYGAGRGAWPGLLELPSGRLYCYYWRQQTSGDMQIDMSYSDDSGASWSVGATSVLPAALSYNTEGGGTAGYSLIQRIRVAHNPATDEILMFVECRLADTTASADRDVFIQYASTDLGSSFTLVDTVLTSETTYTGARPSIVVVDGVFVVGWSGLDGNLEAHCIRLASAFDLFTDQGTPIDIDGTITSGDDDGGNKYFTSADFSMALSDDGVLYATWRASDAGFNYEAVVKRSLDGGSTWENLGQSTVSSASSFWWIGANNQNYPSDFVAVWHDGRLAVVHHWTAATSTAEMDSVAVAYLGGASTVTMRSYDGTGRSTEQTSFEVCWLPFEEPDSIGWTLTTGGTHSEDLADGALNLDTTTGAAYYTRTTTGTIAEGCVFECDLLPGTGSSHTTQNTHARIVLADGTNDYTVSLRIGTTAVRLYDDHAAAAVGTATIDTSGGVSIRVEMSSSTVRWWVRQFNTSSDREWVAQTGSSSLTNETGAPAANGSVRFGNATSSTSISDWYRVAYVTDEWAGDITTAQSNPDGLHPKPYANVPVYVNAGTYIRAVDGPTLHDDVWHIDTRYDYEITRILPWVESSPRRGWRSTDETVHRIALPLDGTLTVDSRMGNVLMGVACISANWRTGAIQEDTGGGSWSNIATFDAADGLASMNYTRVGNTLVPGASGTDTPYLFMNECRGWTVSLGSGKFRRIKWNTEGVWDTADTNKRPVLVMDGVDGTEPGSGTMALVPDSFTFVWRNNAPDYAGLRLVIDAQTTVDGHFKLGNMVLGHVAVFGQQYSPGRVIETAANVEITEADDWTSQAVSRSPVRRRFDIAWVDPIYSAPVHGSAPTPDYVTTSTTGGTKPAAVRDDTMFLVEGLMSYTTGALVPIVYLDKIGKGPSDTEVINRRHRLIYARPTSPVSLESVYGDEGSGEMWRIATISGTELV